MRRSRYRVTTRPILLALSLVGAGILAQLCAPPGGWAAATTVREPAFGLPHIYADTDAELARENGREIAKDRLGQLILLARVGRGTLFQAFGLLDASTLNDDIEARQLAYTSSELNNMFAKLPQRERDLVLKYCEGVNDTIEAVYAGSLPQPIEVSLLRTFLGLGADLFGNATNVSDAVDPNYRAPGGADPLRPNAGFQFTPELAIAIGILEVRNFGLGGFDEVSRLGELQALIAVHGSGTGTELWDDRNFINDPLAPITVPDPSTPGFGGPLALRRDGRMFAAYAGRFPRYGYLDSSRQRAEAAEARAESARRLGAWPALGSYAWIIAGNKSATGNPWIGGFPQTGIQTPSIMHFVENRSGEGSDHRIQSIGMEFPGAPIVLIGQTDTVAWTSTTAQLRVVDTYLEEICNEPSNDAVEYNGEGTCTPLLKRTETFRGNALPDRTRVFWRSHETNGNGGSRAVADFLGDAEGSAEGGSLTTLVDNQASFAGGFVGGHVLITGGPGAGQIREISAAGGTTLTVAPAFTTAPGAGTATTGPSVYVAVQAGNVIKLAAVDSAAWLEESTTVLGFAQFPRAENVLDVRVGSRLMPTTHNFPSADNKPFNGVGTQNGIGNTAYYSSGFSRIRQGGEDPRLPLDGTATQDPLIVASCGGPCSGTVAGSGNNTLTASTTLFGANDFSPEPINFRYTDTSQLGSDYIVAITSGTGYKQTRRIASNTSDTLTIEFPWGVNPAVGDTFEIYEVAAMPEAVNASEGYTSNWNNKAATADDGDGFGRQHRNVDILARLEPENAWTRAKQRQLNKDLAGLDGRGAYGRYIIPRLRDAVDAVGNGGNPAVDTVLAALEAFQASPDSGRFFIDPVTDTRSAGELAFLNTLVNQLAQDIYGGEYSGAISVPGGTDGLNLVQHAIDSAAADVPGSYAQAYSGDYFNGMPWEQVVRDRLSTLATGGIPADTPHGACQGGPDLYERCTANDQCTDDAACPGGNCNCVGNSTYAHPLAALFPVLNFEPTPQGNRGTYEQIVEVGSVVNGEFIFPLGQSGLIEGSLGGGVTSIDSNVTSLQPIWRDWRFVPMLHVSQDLQAGGSPDGDGDGVWDGFERWYYGTTSGGPNQDTDGDTASTLDEFLAGTDPTDPDTDDDGILDGLDTVGQNRLRSGIFGLLGGVTRSTTPNRDRLRLVAKLGTSAGFDIAADVLTVTVRDDDGDLYSVTLQGSDFTVSGGGRVVDVPPAGRDLPLELGQQVVQIGERFLLDPPGARAQALPVGHRGDRGRAPLVQAVGCLVEQSAQLGVPQRLTCGGHEPRVRSHGLHILKSSDSQILRFSNPQILKSSNPQILRFSCSLRQYLGNVHRPDVHTAAAHEASDVHQAPGVAGDHAFSTGLPDAIDLVACHRG